MGLEAATYISQLVASNPVGATDPRSQGDDHLRLIKAVLLATLPALTGAVTATHTELNQLHGGVITSVNVGAVGAPAYSFVGDTDTGMWRSAANVLDFAVAGANRLSLSFAAVSPAVPVLGVNGLVSAPTYSFAADSNTGIFRSAAGFVDIASIGSLVAQFFGGATPQLGVAAGAAAAPSLTFFSNSNTGIYREAANRIGFSSNGVACASVDTTRFGLAVPVWATDGAVGSPGISYILDTDTGLYRPSSNALAIACGGAASAAFTTTNAQFLDGTINNPGLTFLSEGTSGLARTATSTIVLSAGGAQCITADNVSNSGLGQVRIHKQLYLDVNSSSAATAGAGSALPATPQGYIAVTINGTQRRIPYYAD